MGLYRRADSPFWWYSITIKGHRLRECSGTAERTAATRLEKRRREQLTREIGEGRKPELTIDAAFIRYWQEHAERLPSAPDIARIGETIIRAIGPQLPLSRLGSAEVAAFAAHRRTQVSAASVNRELTILRAVFRMAALRWGISTSLVDWKRQFLTEPAPRARVLSSEEEARLFAALRPDFHPLIRFALLSGVRLDNALRLKWDQVMELEGVINLKIKSRRPGGETHAIPLTRSIRAILSAERGGHPVYVFTFVPQRARSAKPAENIQKQYRQPFTRAGWRKSWAAALREAGIQDFRFHDLRHTFCTRLYRQTRDLRLVQKAAGHKEIATTLRYENSGIEDVRAAMEALEAGEIAAERRRK